MSVVRWWSSRSTWGRTTPLLDRPHAKGVNRLTGNQPDRAVRAETASPGKRRSTAGRGDPSAHHHPDPGGESRGQWRVEYRTGLVRRLMHRIRTPEGTARSRSDHGGRRYGNGEREGWQWKNKRTLRSHLTLPRLLPRLVGLRTAYTVMAIVHTTTSLTTSATGYLAVRVGRWAIGPVDVSPPTVGSCYTTRYTSCPFS